MRYGEVLCDSSYCIVYNTVHVESVQYCTRCHLQVSMGFGTDARSYMISANWDPTDPHFEVLNTETAKGQC